VRIGVLGTGMVGRALSGKLAELGHDTRIGTRDVASAMANTEAARDGSGTLAEWAARTPDVQVATFEEAAAHGEAVFNATAGMASLDALRMAGEKNLDGKVLIDVSNPLDFSRGMPPSLTVPSTDSVAEQIQRRFPQARVAKALNTVNVGVMVDPESIPGAHEMFLCGNDETAKDEVRSILGSFGWSRDRIIDLGDLTAARGMEAYVLFWVQLMRALGGPQFNIHVVRP